MTAVPVVAERNLAGGLVAARHQQTRRACQARQQARDWPAEMAGAIPAIVLDQAKTVLATDWPRQARLVWASWPAAMGKACLLKTVCLLVRVGETLQTGQERVLNQAPTVPGNADAPPSILWSCPLWRPVIPALHNSGRQWRLPTALHRNGYKWSQALLTFGPQ